jgi:tetratricopeptide (TPR) repeat protein/tRNA A-37 threonylcarbamoyl transferase component Bud32
MTAERVDSELASSADSVERAAEAVRHFARSLWLDLIRRDQSDRWTRGAGVPAESYFELLPELRENREEALVLVCGEVRSRCEAGERVALADFAQRFPDFADDLAIQFELDGVLGNLTGGVPEPSDAEPDSIHLPGFQILRPVGRGASSRVYLARQISVDRLVAIKVIPVWNLDESQLRRHWQEASILSKLRHPNVVQIYDVIEADNTLYSVIEYVDGPTLAEFTAGQPQAPAAAARLVQVLAQAVHAVHEAGILHRDLKPSNVLMTSRGEPKITDFGLAKLLSNNSLITTAHCLLGTPSYMPPEQAGGDSRATFREGDIYSLGAILYELLTGLPPFLGVTILDTLAMIRERDPIPPRSSQPRIPRDLETICLKCLSKSPHARYRTGEELADDLGRFLAGRTIRARRPAILERVARWSRRNPVIAALAACLVLTGLVGFSGVVWQWRQAERARQNESVARREADAHAREASLGLERLKLANGYLERGEGYLLARRWDDALTSFTRAIELRPDHVQVWEARGEFLYVRLGLWDLAARDVRRAFELQPPRLPERWWWNALLRLHERDVAGYRTLCAQFRERQKQNGSADFAYYLIFALGLSPTNQDSAAKLLELADELAASIPNQCATYHLQGLALLRAGQARAAIERCRQSLAAESHGFCREFNYPILALAHHQLGENSEARAAFDEAVQSMRNWTSQRCDPGSDSWVATFGATGIWPVSTWDWLQCEILVREARTALGLNPIDEDPRCFLLRARAFAGLRRFEEADAVFQAALQRLPQDRQILLETHRNRAYCFALGQKYAEAADEFGLASDLSPGDCRLLGFRALMQCASGQIEPYRKTCAQLVKTFGQIADRLVANSVVHACVLQPQSLADVQSLIVLAERAKSSYFGSVRVLGTAYYRAGRYREAIECFQQASRITPLKPWELAFLAMSHFRLGHREDARRILDSTLQWIEQANNPDPIELSGAKPAWDGWYERVEVPLIVAEARALIGSAQISAEAGSSPK